MARDIQVATDKEYGEPAARQSSKLNGD